MSTTISESDAPIGRRERNRIETRDALGQAAFELAVSHGVRNLRVPDIAERAGVSPRTFNNYFSSREAAIVWPAAQRQVQVAERLRVRPASEPLSDAVVAALTAGYRDEHPGHRSDWLNQFRTMVASDPALHGAYLRASVAAEQALADAIGNRPDAPRTQLEQQILAGVVTAAERAAIRHWMATPHAPRTTRLDTTIAKAIRFALSPR